VVVAVVVVIIMMINTRSPTSVATAFAPPVFHPARVIVPGGAGSSWTTASPKKNVGMVAKKKKNALKMAEVDKERQEASAPAATEKAGAPTSGTFYDDEVSSVFCFVVLCGVSWNCIPPVTFFGCCCGL
jgi:hypothetical protein